MALHRHLLVVLGVAGSEHYVLGGALHGVVDHALRNLRDGPSLVDGRTRVAEHLQDALVLDHYAKGRQTLQALFMYKLFLITAQALEPNYRQRRTPPALYSHILLRAVWCMHDIIKIVFRMRLMSLAVRSRQILSTDGALGPTSRARVICAVCFGDLRRVR